METAGAYFSGGWRGLPFSARWHRLIVAGTGLGKTRLAHMVAAQCKASFLGVNVSSWIPAGSTATQGQQTARSLAILLCRAERVVLLLDELDKLVEESSWVAYLRAEIYAILDQRLPIGLSLDDEDGNISVAARKLRTSCFIIGSGTWQDIWDKGASKVGFGSSSESVDSLRPDQLAQTLPRELVNRFCADLILMEPMKRHDYVAVVDSAAASLVEPLRSAFRANALNAIDAAMAAKSGCRFIEAALMQTLVEEAFPAQQRPIRSQDPQLESVSLS